MELREQEGWAARWLVVVACVGVGFAGVGCVEVGGVGMASVGDVTTGIARRESSAVRSKMMGDMAFVTSMRAMNESLLDKQTRALNLVMNHVDEELARKGKVSGGRGAAHAPPCNNVAGQVVRAIVSSGQVWGRATPASPIVSHHRS